MVGGGGSSDEVNVHLNLVPLIDVLCNILFFLMMSFAAQEMKYEGELKLPSADTQQNAEPDISVTIKESSLLVGDLEVAKIEKGKLLAEQEGAKIIPLYETLNRIREQRGDAPRKEDDVVYFFADKTAPFSLLSPVMKTAAMAGFPHFKLAVIKR